MQKDSFCMDLFSAGCRTQYGINMGVRDGQKIDVHMVLPYCTSVLYCMSVKRLGGVYDLFNVLHSCLPDTYTYHKYCKNYTKNSFLGLFLTLQPVYIVKITKRNYTYEN